MTVVITSIVRITQPYCKVKNANCNIKTIGSTKRILYLYNLYVLARNGG
jgi:hypothetical protein